MSFLLEIVVSVQSGSKGFISDRKDKQISTQKVRLVSTAIVQSRYNEDFGALISKATIVQASSVLRDEDLPGEDIRVYYNSLEEFQTLAEHFGIFRDLKVTLSLANVHLQRWKQYFNLAFFLITIHVKNQISHSSSQKLFKSWWVVVSLRLFITWICLWTRTTFALLGPLLSNIAPKHVSFLSSKFSSCSQIPN